MVRPRGKGGRYKPGGQGLHGQIRDDEMRSLGARMRLGLRVALLPLLVSTMLVTPSGAAPSGCVFNATSGDSTCTFGYTGGEQSFTVPADVHSVSVVAQGSSGAAGYVPGGRGAVVGRAAG